MENQTNEIEEFEPTTMELIIMAIIAIVVLFVVANFILPILSRIVFFPLWFLCSGGGC